MHNFSHDNPSERPDLYTLSPEDAAKFEQLVGGFEERCPEWKQLLGRIAQAQAHLDAKKSVTIADIETEFNALKAFCCELGLMDATMFVIGKARNLDFCSDAPEEIIELPIETDDLGDYRQIAERLICRGIATRDLPDDGADSRSRFGLLFDVEYPDDEFREDDSAIFMLPEDFSHVALKDDGAELDRELSCHTPALYAQIERNFPHEHKDLRSVVAGLKEFHFCRPEKTFGRDLPKMVGDCIGNRIVFDSAGYDITVNGRISGLDIEGNSVRDMYSGQIKNAKIVKVVMEPLKDKGVTVYRPALILAIPSWVHGDGYEVRTVPAESLVSMRSLRTRPRDLLGGEVVSMYFGDPDDIGEYYKPQEPSVSTKEMNAYYSIDVTDDLKRIAQLYWEERELYEEHQPDRYPELSPDEHAALLQLAQRQKGNKAVTEIEPGACLQVSNECVMDADDGGVITMPKGDKICGEFSHFVIIGWSEQGAQAMINGDSQTVPTLALLLENATYIDRHGESIRDGDVFTPRRQALVPITEGIVAKVLHFGNEMIDRE